MKGASQIAPFGLRMPEELKEAISKRAKKNGRSMNAEIVFMLEKELQRTVISELPEDDTVMVKFTDEQKAAYFERLEAAQKAIVEAAALLNENQIKKTT
ncbi:Arc family DNA-binding protein [Pantoea ananatis]|uniref:Arc family DNA-binding protein n=1 Tax=Pantoea ananas TaxID=553 RepID=UPI003FA48EF1